MKIISNDLRSSCRSLLLGAYQEGGGSTPYNTVFHDILNNSDKVADIPIYDDYRITVNVWANDRQDVYEGEIKTITLASKQSDEEILRQDFYYSTKNVCIVYIAWRGDTPLYAQVGDIQTLSYDQQYSDISVYESSGTRYPYTLYVYQRTKEDYIKGSAALASEIDHYVFGSGGFGNCITPCDSSGNQVSLSVSFRTDIKTFTAAYPPDENGNPDTTKVPSAIQTGSSENNRTINAGTGIQYLINNYRGTFSDFTSVGQLISAHTEVVGAMCLASGTEYRMAELLPESEE